MDEFSAAFYPFTYDSSSTTFTKSLYVKLQINLLIGKDMVFISVGEKHFCVLLVLFSCSLYLNTLRGGFIWDDRAAVVTNEDVHGTGSDFWKHDFWGKILL